MGYVYEKINGACLKCIFPCVLQSGSLIKLTSTTIHTCIQQKEVRSIVYNMIIT
jgi:hypothetical protein